MLTTFNNVCISIEAATPEDAYMLLCDLFEPAVCANILEYSTDTFSTDTKLNHDTGELWPQEAQ